FSFSVVDAGLVRLLPTLLSHLEVDAPGVRLRVTPMEFEALETALEAGHLDCAMGSHRSRPARARAARRHRPRAPTRRALARARAAPGPHRVPRADFHGGGVHGEQ